MTQWGLDTLFNPAKRHMDEEKRRLQSTREEVGDNSGGKRIDLESGKVIIHSAESESESEADAEAGSDPAAAPSEKDAANAARRARSRAREMRQSRSDGQSNEKGPDKSKREDRRGKTRSDRGEDGKPTAAAIRAAQRRGRSI